MSYSVDETAQTFTDKTNFVLFHPRQNLFDKGNLSIKFNNKKLKPVDYVKYLGMYLDKRLSRDMHIDQLRVKLSRVNGIRSKCFFVNFKNRLIY